MSVLSAGVGFSVADGMSACFDSIDGSASGDAVRCFTNLCLIAVPLYGALTAFVIGVPWL